MTALAAVENDELAFAVTNIASPSTVRRVLLTRPEVRGLVKAFAQGSVTRDDIAEWVTDKLYDLSRGTRFPHDYAFAALAVALESNPSAVAGTLLEELAALRIEEMPVSQRVAAISRRQRARRFAANAFVQMRFAREDREGIRELGTANPRPGFADSSRASLVLTST